MNFNHNLSICFDLDGTLVDTAPDLVRVLNEIVAAEGLPEVDFDQARNLVGYGARRLIQHAYDHAGESISADHADKLLAKFLESYEREIARLSRPYPGVLGTLIRLKNEGMNLSICTNKPGYLARPLIEALGMRPYFDRIVGSRDGVRTKPHADHVFAAAGHRRARDIIMVGDSMPDVLAARAAGVPVIVMSYGYANMPSARLRADKTLRQFRDLPAAIHNLGMMRFRQNSRSSLPALH